jgi:hypothetical protein
MKVTGGCHCGAVRFEAEFDGPPVPALDCNCAANHLFCEICGVKSFYQPRSHPDAWSVNANCLDLSVELAIERFDGANWEEAIKQLPGEAV